jgi:hypothetical protein
VHVSARIVGQALCQRRARAHGAGRAEGTTGPDGECRPLEFTLSDNQKKNLLRLAHKYRRQLPDNFLRDLLFKWQPIRWPGRATGRTSRQLNAAPRNAFFVCPNHAAIPYTVDLAKEMGRYDIQFLCPEDVRERIRGCRNIVIIDHDTILTDELRKYVSSHNQALEGAR